MLLGWCGPVGGWHVTPVCVWNSRDLSGYAQECVWGDKLPPHRAQKHRQQNRDGEKQLSSRPPLLSLLNQDHFFFFFSLRCWPSQTTVCFTEFEGERVCTDQWESKSQTCLSPDGWMELRLHRKACLSFNLAAEPRLKSWQNLADNLCKSHSARWLATEWRSVFHQ